MRRREFLCGLGGVATSWPIAARAQQGGRMRRIGVLMSLARGDSEGPPRMEAFRNALRELGWIVDSNIKVDYRWPGADRERLQADVADLIAQSPDLILATYTPALAAVRAMTRDLPILFLNVTDPVGQGFVDSLAKPGGNTTGFTSFEFSMGGKWIETLKEIAPSVTRLALLHNPTTAPYIGYYVRSFEAAAPQFGVLPKAAVARDAAGIERSIAEFAREPNGGLLVLPDVTMGVHRDLIISLVDKYKLPTVYPYRYYVAAGGLISYGVNLPDLFRRAASYADRIIKSGKPGDLPVQQPVKFELCVNLQAARKLGLSASPTLLARADEVIE